MGGTSGGTTGGTAGEGGARWLTLAAVLASFFWMLGAAPLFDVDEGAFSQATLEMFERGDFLSTYLNGEPRYDKPILVYWLQAAAVALIGPSEWAFRLPSALCATLWTWFTYLFVRRHYGIERARFAAVLLATSLGVFIIGRAATADALLNMLIAASMFAAWQHLSTGRRGWLYATHAAIGLGVLAKGPIAILVPFATTLLYCWLRRDLRTWARAVFDGRVVFSDWFKGYGQMVVIDHGDSYLSIYGHVDERLVSAGEDVSRGDLIARSGQSGSFEEPGLYFEIRHDGRPEDPARWLRGAPGALAERRGPSPRGSRETRRNP